MASKDDVVEQIVDHDTSPAQDVNNAVGGDDELAELLTSALDDFNKEPQPSKATAEPPSQKAPSGKKKKKATTTNHPEASSSGGPIPFGLDGANSVDEVFQNLFSQDPVLKEHWEKLAESCSKAAQDPDFEKSLEETIKNLSANAESIAQNPELSEEDLAKVWSDLGLNDPSKVAEGPLPDIMPLITNMMQNLLSKEVLYPALKDLTVRYPEWLEEHKGDLKEDEISRYEKQLDLMRNVCQEFEAESSEDLDSVKNERFQRILSLMQQMQECGSPPKELVGDVPDLASTDFSKLPGFGSNGAQCCIQ